MPMIQRLAHLIRRPHSSLYSLVPPSDRQIKAFIGSQQGKPYSYPEVGRTRNGPQEIMPPLPPQYRMLYRRFHLGRGEKKYQKAKQAFLQWGMFALDWVRVHPETPGMDEQTLVGIVSHVFGLWTVNVCRIVYCIDEPSGSVVRFGCGYGTLPGHAIRGEEKMMITLDQNSGEVSYEIFSFSMPNQLVAKLAPFQLRLLQKRFVRESGHRMRQFCRD